MVREPCERFASQLDHMRRVDPTAFGHMNASTFARYLLGATGSGVCAPSLSPPPPPAFTVIDVALVLAMVHDFFNGVPALRAC